MTEERGPSDGQFRLVCKNCDSELTDDHTGPCPECGATDSLEFRSTLGEASATIESVVIAVKNASGTLSVRDTEYGKRRSKIDDLAEEGVSAEVAGTSPQNEEGSLGACRILIEHLNQHGARWSEPSKPDPDRGIDCISHDEQRELRIQVTRPAAESFWRELGGEGQVRADLPHGEIARQLLDSIRSKGRSLPRQDRSATVLVLDARHLPLALRSGAQYFCHNHSADARAVGFKSVWLVGPTSELVWQLDVDTAS